MKQIISTSEAPAAIGAYSQAVVANGMLFASGQLGIDPATGEFAGADFRSQAEQAVKNVAAILNAAGTDASHVVKTTVYLTNMENFAILNEVYSTLFEAPFPARSAVAVAALRAKGNSVIEETIFENEGDYLEGYPTELIGNAYPKTYTPERKYTFQYEDLYDQGRFHFEKDETYDEKTAYYQERYPSRSPCQDK